MVLRPPSTSIGSLVVSRLPCGKRFFSSLPTLSNKATSDSLYPTSRAHTGPSRPLPPLSRTSVLKRSQPSAGQHTDEGDVEDAQEGKGILSGPWTDLKIKTLLADVSSKGSAGDILGVLRLASRIKQQVGRSSKLENVDATDDAAAGQSLFDLHPPPRQLYYDMMLACSSPNLLPLAQAIYADMQKYHPPSRRGLSLLLRCAVTTPSTSIISGTLDSIAALDSMAAPHERVSQSPRAAGLLSAAYTREWTPATYRFMLQHAAQARLPELALSLLGAAPSHMYVDILTPRVQDYVIVALASAREARLCADMAVWMEQRSNRGAEPHAWMRVLRVCAAERWVSDCWPAYSESIILIERAASISQFPGMQLAYRRGVVAARQPLDEGLLMSMLACAVQAVQPAFIVTALADHLGSRQAASQEWHYAPLFEAYCAAGNFEEALRTLGDMARAGLQPLSFAALRSLIAAASSSNEACGEACRAFTTVGRDARKRGGNVVGALNALIQAAANIGDTEQALKLYHERVAMRSATSATVPPSASSDTLGAGWPSAQAATHVIGPDAPGLRADIDTYHAMLTVCINAVDRYMGTLLLRDLAAHQPALVPTEVTYERAIVLCCTQHVYEDAFAFLEEAKSRGIVPTRASYTAIISACRNARDDRYARIQDEASQYYDSPALFQCDSDDGFRRTARGR